MKFKILILLIFVALVVKMKYMVNTLSSSVKLMNIEIAQAKDDLDILRAEYAYLERPSRILEEGEKLGMSAVKPNRIIYLNDYLERFKVKSVEHNVVETQ